VLTSSKAKQSKEKILKVTENWGFAHSAV
jgi:hypothetical protein